MVEWDLLDRFIATATAVLGFVKSLRDVTGTGKRNRSRQGYETQTRAQRAKTAEHRPRIRWWVTWWLGSVGILILLLAFYAWLSIYFSEYAFNLIIAYGFGLVLGYSQRAILRYLMLDRPVFVNWWIGLSAVVYFLVTYVRITALYDFDVNLNSYVLNAVSDPSISIWYSGLILFFPPWLILAMLGSILLFFHKHCVFPQYLPSTNKPTKRLR